MLDRAESDLSRIPDQPRSPAAQTAPLPHSRGPRMPPAPRAPDLPREAGQVRAIGSSPDALLHISPCVRALSPTCGAPSDSWNPSQSLSLKPPLHLAPPTP